MTLKVAKEGRRREGREGGKEGKKKNHWSATTTSGQ